MKVNIYNCLDLLRDSLFHNKIPIGFSSLLIKFDVFFMRLLTKNNRKRNNESLSCVAALQAEDRGRVGPGSRR